jgi:hypothetical protein
MIIFNFVFDLYKNTDEETGLEYMDAMSTVHFIRGCTNETCQMADNRITGLF